MENTNHIIDDLVAEYLDESISEDSLQLLCDHLRENPELCKDLRSQLVLRERISSHYANLTAETTQTQALITPIEAEGTPVETVITPVEASPALVEKKKNILPFIPLVSIAATLILLATLSLFLFKRNKIEIGTYSNTLSEKRERICSNDTLKASVGTYTLTLDNGAQLALEAPFECKILDDRRIRLQNGLLVAHCPTSDSTVTIIQGDKEITDLGTAFGVDTTPSGLEVIVLSGKIKAKNGNKEKKVRMSEALKLDNTEGFRSIPYNTDKYTNALSSFTKYDIKTIGDVKVVNVWDLGNANLFTGCAMISHEKADLSGRIELRAEEFGASELDSTSNPYRINVAEDSPVHSYLLRSHPSSDAQIRKGSVTFEDPIVGVISQQKNLNTFEKQFSFSHNSAHLKYRGLEPNGESADTFSLSEDRKTLHFTLYTGDSVDDIRILVQE